jgi:Flp pilus assembly pilin Flp
MGHLLCKLERSFHAGLTARLSETDFALRQLWSDESGQDVAEYSVMLAVILVIVIGTIRLIGSNASNIFSQVGSTIQ